MILHVALWDVLWFAVVLVLHRAATPRARRWTGMMLGYVAIELFFHVPMENAVAALLAWSGV